MEKKKYEYPKISNEEIIVEDLLLVSGRINEEVDPENMDVFDF